MAAISLSGMGVAPSIPLPSRQKIGHGPASTFTPLTLPARRCQLALSGMHLLFPRVLKMEAPPSGNFCGVPVHRMRTVRPGTRRDGLTLSPGQQMKSVISAWDLVFRP